MDPRKTKGRASSSLDLVALIFLRRRKTNPPQRPGVEVHDTEEDLWLGKWRDSGGRVGDRLNDI